MSASHFTVALEGGATRPDDWASGGFARFASEGDDGGQNAEVEVEIKKWLENGSGSNEVFLHYPFPFVPAVGDALVIEEACGHSFTMCKIKQLDPANPTSSVNALNFGGFPFAATGRRTTRSYTD